MSSTLNCPATLLLSALISYLELHIAHKKSPAWQARWWIALRLAVDGSTGAFAYTVLTEVLSGLKWFSGPWPILVSGLAGPALLRSQLALLGSGLEDVSLGPANVYCRIRAAIDFEIDNIGSAAQEEWLSSALTYINLVPVPDICRRTESYLRGLDSLNGEQVQAEIKYLREVISDRSISTYDRIGYVMQHLLDIGGRRFVENLIDEGQRRNISQHSSNPRWRERGRHGS